MSDTHILSEETQSVQQNVDAIHFEIENKLSNKQDDNLEIDKASNTETEEDDTPTTPLQEAKIICSLAIPISISTIADFSMWTTDIIFLGHLGTKQLAGAAIADSCLEIFRNFVVTPMYSVNALCSQALGSDNKYMVGYWFQLALMMCTLQSIPCSIAYYYSSDIVTYINHDEDVIKYTKLYTHYGVMILWLDAVISGIAGMHQSLEIVRPFTVIAVVFIGMNIISNQIWIYSFNLQFIGSPLATQFSWIIWLIVLYLWCFVYKKYHLVNNVWNGWSLRETILNKKRVWEFTKIVIPLTLGNAAESWGYQVVNLYAARLEPAQIASLSCSFTIWGILYAFWQGFGAAILTRVGKKIGAGNVDGAKMVSKIALVTSSIVAMIMGCIVFISSKQIAMLYSKDPEVHEIMSQCVRFVCILYVIGSVGWCAMNILEAMSKNTAPSVINVVTSWLGYVPACVYLMTGDNYKMFGDNVSPVACIFIVGVVVELLRTVSLWIIVIRTDWNKACIEAQERNEENKDDKDSEKDNKENEVVSMDDKKSIKKIQNIDYVNLEDEQLQIA